MSRADDWNKGSIVSECTVWSLPSRQAISGVQTAWRSVYQIGGSWTRCQEGNKHHACLRIGMALKMTAVLFIERNVKNDGNGVELGCITYGLERRQRGMMTGRRPLDDISTLQSAGAYHQILDMLVWLTLTVYLSEIAPFLKLAGTGFDNRASVLDSWNSFSKQEVWH